MIDSFTSRLRLRKPEVGAKLDEWAPPISAGLNDGVADMIDQAMAQIINIDVGVGNVILSTAEGTAGYFSSGSTDSEDVRGGESF